MTNFTTAKALSEIRAYAKNLGMTFKRQNATVNGQAAYVLTERKSGKVLLQNFTLWTAYNAMLGGCLDKVARDASLTTPSMEKIMTTVYDLKRLNAMRKDKLFSLCLKHFGQDTASIYRYYTKVEMIDDLLTVTKDQAAHNAKGNINHSK